jgi:hypothetical protein
LGGPVVFSQALYRLRSKHDDERLREIMDRLFVYSIHVQDISMDYFMDLDRWNAYRLHVREKDTMSWEHWTGKRLDIGPKGLIVVGEEHVEHTDQQHTHSPAIVGVPLDCGICFT